MKNNFTEDTSGCSQQIKENAGIFPRSKSACQQVCLENEYNWICVSSLLNSVHKDNVRSSVFDSNIRPHFIPTRVETLDKWKKNSKNDWRVLFKIN